MKLSPFPGWIPSRAALVDGSDPELPGEYGKILWFDEQTLAVYLTTPRRMARAAALPGARPFAIGDSEGTILLPADQLDAAARLIGATRHRSVSEERRQQLREIGARSQFGIAEP